MKPFLKCDAAGCDHVEDIDAFKAEYIGKPCPKCGASLLTKEDWDGFQPMLALFTAMEAFGIIDDNCKDGVPVIVGHHDGETKIKLNWVN